MTDFDVSGFLSRHAPFDGLPPEVLADLANDCTVMDAEAGTTLYRFGQPIERLLVVVSGLIDLVSPEAEHEIIFRYASGDTVGVRGLLRDGLAVADAVVRDDARVIQIETERFRTLMAENPRFDGFFDATRAAQRRAAVPATDTATALLSVPITEIMTRDPVTVAPDATVASAARTMRDRHISCVLIAEDDGRLVGILTTRNLTGLVADARSPDTPVSKVMASNPYTLTEHDAVLDAILEMSERSIGHVPIVDGGRAIGIVTRTDVIQRDTNSAAAIITEIGRQDDLSGLQQAVRRLPMALAQMVGAGLEPRAVGHLVTGVTDALTRRLLSFALTELGPAPVPFLWLACGSQGRREQTGTSDQDNVLILSEDYEPEAHGAYFETLAQRVCDGLDACGYVYCPGDMMATNPQWRQPVSVWRRYFRGWIDRPDPMAQMLASVMFDLRPITGDTSLFEGIKAETLEHAAKNSIFRAHMIANSLKHVPPLSLFRGFALIRSGEHKNTMDLKLNGIVPIVDLARVYALDAKIEAVNTRDRLLEAKEAGSLSQSGADDLIAAYDLIGSLRLEHQASQIREGEKPDNFLAPSSLSALERNHLKDAFGVIKTMQSALSARAPV